MPTLHVRPKVALFSAVLDDPYQFAIWQGVRQELSGVGVDLIAFNGHRLGSPLEREARENAIYGLAQTPHIAAVIAVTSAMGTYVDDQQMQRFLSVWQHLPLITIGTDVGRRFVPRPRSGGIEQAVTHLITVHGRSRFLFLAGPEGHQESQQRLEEFLSSLDHHHIPRSAATIRFCDFLGDRARRAVRRALTEGLNFDAVVAANDTMAIGAIEVLETAGFDTAGLTVPGDISVVGYDDTSECSTMIPSLSTVRQPAFELGRQAAWQIAEQLGFPVNREALDVQTRFIVRESCGCQPGGPFPADVALGKLRQQGTLRRLVERRSIELSEIEVDIVSSLETADVLRAVARGMQFLQVPSCRLVLVDLDGGQAQVGQVLLTVDGEAIGIHAPGEVVFPLIDLMPGGIPAGWGTCICDPLSFGEHRMGYLLRSEPGTDQRFFESLRKQAGSALQGTLQVAAERAREKLLELDVQRRIVELSVTNERLIEEARQREALEREILTLSNDLMDRIGRDIHDDLCQEIAGIGLMAALLEGRLKRQSFADAQLWAGQASEIATAASKTATKAKGFARSLYPTELEGRGLIAAISDLVVSVQARSVVPIGLSVPETMSLKDPDKSLQLYRIVQEALGNAVVHAGASEIRISLAETGNSVEASVSDNGHGIGTLGPAPPGTGMGLKIMRYRASVIGAILGVQTSSRGTTISCSVKR